MANTIVLSVARRATFARSIAVTTDPARIELHLADDERLLAAVGTAGAFIAGRAGLASDAQAAIAGAAEDACRATFPLMSEDAKIDVTVEQFSDRIEVRLSYRARAQATALMGRESAEDAFAVGPYKVKLLSRIDKVQHSTEGEISRTILVKKLHSNPA